MLTGFFIDWNFTNAIIRHDSVLWGIVNILFLPAERLLAAGQNGKSEANGRENVSQFLYKFWQRSCDFAWGSSSMEMFAQQMGWRQQGVCVMWVYAIKSEMKYWKEHTLDIQMCWVYVSLRQRSLDFFLRFKFNGNRVSSKWAGNRAHA